MPLESFFTALGLDGIKAGLRAARRKLSKKRYERLLSSAIATLLAEHPDLELAEASIRAAQATGAPVSAELLRVSNMLELAKTHRVAKTLRASKRMAKKKARRPKRRRR